MQIINVDKGAKVKVLILSHNPICRTNNMGKTFLTLFSAFKKGELCQFYVQNVLPDEDKCSSYYRITDKEALKSVFSFNAKGGEVFFAQNGEKATSNARAVKRSPFKLVLRDIVWKISGFGGKKLDLWVEKEKPDCIFVAPGYSGFIYDLALKISKKYNLPIVIYICDDYCFIKNKGGLFKRLQIDKIRKKMRKLTGKARCAVTISDELKSSYEKEFGVLCKTVMTGGLISPTDAKNYCPADKRDETAAVYLGNLARNRYVSLIEIGKALEKINAEKGKCYKLIVYTGETDEKILAVLSGVKTIEIRKEVKGEEYLKTLCGAEILVHTEAFDEEFVDLVKYSISAKIADLVSSGRKIFVYGPENISSVKYFSKNAAAYVATSKAELEKTLISAFKESGETYIGNARRLAIEYHDLKRNGEEIYGILKNVCEGLPL